jgi:hypothetical protein
MNYSRHQGILLFCFVVTAFAIGLNWMSYRQAKTEWIETKVRQALEINMTMLSPQWSRITTRSTLTPEKYYSPIVDAIQTFDLYRHVLEYLNQDESLPPTKLTQVSIRKDYGPLEDTLICQVKLEFPLFLGIERKTIVLGTVKIPHYATIK